VAKIGGEVVPNRWSGNSKRTVAESGVGALSTQVADSDERSVMPLHLFTFYSLIGRNSMPGSHVPWSWYGPTPNMHLMLITLPVRGWFTSLAVAMGAR